LKIKFLGVHIALNGKEEKHQSLKD